MVKRFHRLGLFLGVLCMAAGAVTTYSALGQDETPMPEMTQEAGVVEVSVTFIPSPTFTPSPTVTLSPTPLPTMTATFVPTDMPPTATVLVEPTATDVPVVEATQEVIVTEEPIVAQEPPPGDQPPVAEAPPVEPTEEVVPVEPTALLPTESLPTVDAPPEVTQEVIIPAEPTVIPPTEQVIVEPTPIVEMTQEPLPTLEATPEVIVPVVEVTPEATAEALPEVTAEATAEVPAAAKISGLVQHPRAGTAPAQITLTLPDGSVVYGAADEQGNFSFADLPAGSYFVEVAATGSLTSSIEVVLADGEQRDLPPLTLKVGDTNGDNVIDILDVMLIAANFDGPAQVAEADVNGDGWIDVRDLSLIGAQVGLAGPLPWH